MNLRTFATVGAVAMLVLGGCVVVGPDGDGGAAGTAGSGGDGNTGNTGGAGGGTAGAGGGTAGAGGGTATCDKTCAEAITNGNPVCADSTASLPLYDALAACSCDRGAADTRARCKAYCGDNVCVNKDSTQA